MTINFNDKVISPFLTNSFPEFFNLPEESSVCLVGNSGAIKESEFGKQIDNYDVVIRFNHGPIEGYEKYVGTKTTGRIVNGHCFGGTTDPKRNPAASKDFLPSRPKQDIICKTFNVDEFFKGVLNNVNLHNLYFLNGEFIQEISKYTPGQEPTAGIVGLFLLLSKFKAVDMYGFSFWSDDYSYHYFENVPYTSSQLGHNFNSEQALVKALQEQNKVKVY